MCTGMRVRKLFSAVQKFQMGKYVENNVTIL